MAEIISGDEQFNPNNKAVIKSELTTYGNEIMKEVNSLIPAIQVLGEFRGNILDDMNSWMWEYDYNDEDEIEYVTGNTYVGFYEICGNIEIVVKIDNLPSGVRDGGDLISRIHLPLSTLDTKAYAISQKFFNLYKVMSYKTGSTDTNTYKLYLPCYVQTYNSYMAEHSRGYYNHTDEEPSPLYLSFEKYGNTTDYDIYLNFNFSWATEDNIQDNKSIYVYSMNNRHFDKYGLGTLEK